jgi:hypothetical protein
MNRRPVRLTDRGKTVLAWTLAPTFIMAVALLDGLTYPH